MNDLKRLKIEYSFIFLLYLVVSLMVMNDNIDSNDWVLFVLFFVILGILFFLHVLVKDDVKVESLCNNCQIKDKCFMRKSNHVDIVIKCILFKPKVDDNNG